MQLSAFQLDNRNLDRLCYIKHIYFRAPSKQPHEREKKAMSKLIFQKLNSLFWGHSVKNSLPQFSPSVFARFGPRENMTGGMLGIFAEHDSEHAGHWGTNDYTGKYPSAHPLQASTTSSLFSGNKQVL